MTRKRPLLRRIVTWTAVGLVAAGAAVLVLRPSPAVVDLGAVDRGPLAETLDEDGKARLQHRALVVAPAAGRLEKPLVAPADTVTEGQLLARLEPLRAPLLDAAARAELQASVRMAEDAARQAGAVVQRALAAAEAAAANLARQEVVTGAGSAPRVVLEEARDRHHAATHEVETARFAERVAGHQLALARATLARATGAGEGPALELAAPLAGVVLAVHLELGGVVQAGTPLFELGDPLRPEVVVPVLSADAAGLAPRTRVRLAGWGGPELAGRVRAVEPRAFTRVTALGVEEQRVPVVVELDQPQVPEGPRLGDGYRVQARFVRWESADVPRAPAGAVFRKGDGWAAFVVEDGRARERGVQVGHRTPGLVEVLGGLSAGERVVLYPTEHVTDGRAVRERER